MSKTKTEQLEELQKAKCKQYQKDKVELGFGTVSLRTRTRNFDGKDVIYAKEIVATIGDKEFIPFGIEYADNGTVGAVYKKMNNTNTSLNIEELLNFDQFKEFVDDRMSQLEKQVTKKSKPVKAVDTPKKETKKTKVSPVFGRTRREGQGL